MSNLLSKRNITIAIIAIAVITAVWFFSSKGDTNGEYYTITAERGELIHKVSVTGDVVAVKEVDLAFEQSAKISNVYVGVGESVVAGQVLLRQNSADIYALLLKAQSDLDTQKALLAELKAGTRPEELRVYEEKLSSAESSLQEAIIDAKHKISDAFTKSDNAIRNDADQLFSNPRGANPEFNFTMSDQQLKNEIELGRFLVEEVLDNWANDLQKINNDNVFVYLSGALENASEVKNLLDKISLAVNALGTSGSLTQTTIDGYKSDISGARISVNTAITNLNSVREKLSTAQSNLQIAQSELALKRAGATAEQISTQEAKVKSAEASVANYQAILAKRVLRAPFAGVVTKQDAKVGEIATANTTLVSLVSDSAYEIETYIPEADIAKIKIGDSAEFDLDAYDSDVKFSAKVVSVEPAETVIEGVSTYKTILQIVNTDERIRLGMTANVDILTAKKSDVLAIPSRALYEKNGEKFVRILLENTTIEERKVQTGLRGSDGRVEIVSGVEAGEKVITFERK